MDNTGLSFKIMVSGGVTGYTGSKAGCVAMDIEAGC